MSKTKRNNRTMQEPFILATDDKLAALVAYGIEKHRNSDFISAETIYRQALAMNADYADALSLLGLVCQSTGRINEALQCLNHAIAQKIHPVYLVNRSSIFLTMAQYSLAADDAKLAIKLEPKNVDGYVNLLRAYRALNDYRRGLKLGVEACALFPKSADLWNNYGACLLDAGKIDEAYAAFEHSEQIDHLHCTALENLARIAWTKNLSSAQGYSQRAFDLGTGDVQVLLPWLKFMATQLKPDQAMSEKVQNIWSKMIGYGALSQLREHAKSSEFINDIFKVANEQQKERRFDQSHALLMRLSEVLPDNSDVLNNLGVSYFAAENYAQALVCFEKVISLNAISAMGYRNVGVCHFMLIHPEDALASFAKAYALDQSSCASLLLYFGQSLQCCDWTNYAQLKERLVQMTLEQQPDDLTASLAYLAAVEKGADMRVIAAKVAQGLFNRAPVLDGKAPVAKAFKKKRRLRIGYFSYDFRTHPVTYLTEELYGLHDRERFEIFALSYGENDNSSFRKTVETDVDHFVELSGLTLKDMATRIRELNLDIVVDLTGNTQGNKSAVLGARVAPIQCHWLGYVWSMGHNAYDYIIADSFSVPVELESAYVEKIARLPYTLQICSRRLKAADKKLTRAEMGLPNDAFVMANFGSFSKIQPELFTTWMNILKAVPNAVLWLARTNRTPPVAFERIRLQVLAHGVDASRVVFSEPMSRDEHLLRYELADVALDTYPQGSGTTAIESLWMGCPMLSMAGAGETLAIRMAGGILNAVGLDDLVVDSLQAYQALAIDLAQNPEICQQYRTHLQSNKENLPLFDTPRTVAYLENCFETMWAQAIGAQKIDSFTVALDFEPK